MNVVGELSRHIDAVDALAVKVIILLCTLITGYQFIKNKWNH